MMNYGWIMNLKNNKKELKVTKKIFKNRIITENNFKPLKIIELHLIKNEYTFY